MESPVTTETKYQKLAAEYSKIRAQATVLKRAVLEEQNKNSCLRESLRLKESTLRKSEQEVDSLGFRNKQLEFRVINLQEDLAGSSNKKKNSNKNVKSEKFLDDSVITEELQKKTLENAKLTFVLSDKDSELLLFKDRINELETQISKQICDQTENERKLRRENEILSERISNLESKLVEATSIIGSEDRLSVAGSDTPVTINSSDERITSLEKETIHWRTQYEILKLKDDILTDEQLSSFTVITNGPCSSSDKKDNSETITREQMLYQSFSHRVEELFSEKVFAESKNLSYLEECKNLQSTLQLTTRELRSIEQKYTESLKKQYTLEEEILTIRKNYTEQVEVLTEQILLLSHQLASMQ